MAVRSTMTYLITFVRELIEDPAGDTQKFTDQQIQDRLDLGRKDLYNNTLVPADTLTSTGTIKWFDWFAKTPFWETDYLLQQVNGTSVTADAAEPLIGKFHFDAAQLQPIVITGKVYNVYNVASILLTMWIGDIRSQITGWTADGTTVQRAGQIRAMQELAKKYAGMGWGSNSQIKLVRKDLRN